MFPSEALDADADLVLTPLQSTTDKSVVVSSFSVEAASKKS